MKKILNEWRKFLKENKKDDLQVAGILLQAMDTGNENVPDMQNELRTFKPTWEEKTIEQDRFF